MGGATKDALLPKQEVSPQSAPKTSSQQPQRKTTQYKILWDTLNVLAGHPGWRAWSPPSPPPTTRMSQVQPHLQLGSKCHRPAPPPPPVGLSSWAISFPLLRCSLCKIPHSTLPLGHPTHLPFFTTSKLMTPKTPARTCLQTPKSTTYKAFPSDSHKHLQLKFSQKLNSSFPLQTCSLLELSINKGTIFQ